MSPELGAFSGRLRSAANVLRWMLVPVVVYGSWLTMLTLHEFGHVLHAWASGGRVVSMTVPFLGFSETVVHPNPRPLFVAWGGALWGVVLPLLLCVVSRLVCRRMPHILRFFAGFCLIANGAYLGIGWLFAAGDPADMRALGTPVWVLVAYGMICVPAGLWLWHRTRGVAGVTLLPR